MLWKCIYISFNIVYVYSNITTRVINVYIFFTKTLMFLCIDGSIDTFLFPPFFTTSRLGVGSDTLVRLLGSLTQNRREHTPDTDVWGRDFLDSGKYDVFFFKYWIVIQLFNLFHINIKQYSCVQHLSKAICMLRPSQTASCWTFFGTTTIIEPTHL